jgi:hypothetical protein
MGTSNYHERPEDVARHRAARPEDDRRTVSYWNALAVLQHTNNVRIRQAAEKAEKAAEQAAATLAGDPFDD